MSASGNLPPVAEESFPKRDVDPGEEVDEEKIYQGNCKWFNVLKGFGFINPDGLNLDCFVHQSQLQMAGFRSLADGERVSFKLRQNRGKGGWEAYEVGPADPGQELKGHHIHPLGKKKETMVRCYKCGKWGYHLAHKCKRKAMGPQVPDAKNCYKCGSPYHLINDCSLIRQQRLREHQVMEPQMQPLPLLGPIVLPPQQDYYPHISPVTTGGYATHRPGPGTYQATDRPGPNRSASVAELPGPSRYDSAEDGPGPSRSAHLPGVSRSTTTVNPPGPSGPARGQNTRFGKGPRPPRY